MRAQCHPARAAYPAWSPDGQRIAFLLQCYRSGVLYLDNAITTIDVDSRTYEIRHKLVSAQPGIRLDWSPDGRRIVFVAAPFDQTGRRIFELTLETGEVRQLIPIVWVATGVPAFYDDFDVAWARVIQ